MMIIMIILTIPLVILARNTYSNDIIGDIANSHTTNANNHTIDINIDIDICIVILILISISTPESERCSEADGHGKFLIFKFVFAA